MLRDIALFGVVILVALGFILADRYPVTSPTLRGDTPPVAENGGRKMPLDGARKLDVEARRMFEAANGSQRDIQKERMRSAELVENLADAKQNASRQIETLQQRIDSETARIASLEQELLAVRQQLAQRLLDVQARDDERRSFEMVKAGIEEKLEQKEKRVGALSDELAEVERSAALQIEALRKELESKRAASGRSDTPGSEAPSAVAPPGTSPGPDTRTSGPLTPLVHQEPAAWTDIALPKDASARLLLRYALHSEAARKRAMEIGVTLRTQGFDVAEPVGSTIGPAGTSVVFFYDEDQSNAKQIANILAAPGPMKGRQLNESSLPRPGTIEVSIAG